ncbi:MAG: hypothetical protein Q9179_006253, partial [Wetmoreana sp. 5 TL-2023]
CPGDRQSQFQETVIARAGKERRKLSGTTPGTVLLRVGHMAKLDPAAPAHLSRGQSATPKAAHIESTTAQDDSQRADAGPQTVMNNDPTPDSKLHEAGHQHPVAIHEQPYPDANTATSNHSVWPSKEETVKANDTAIERNDVNVIDKGDSEAETVVLDGKREDRRESTGKAIKNEDLGDSDGPHSPRSNAFHAIPQTERKTDDGSDRPSLKRKRATEQHTAEENPPTSNLSSTVSSPAAQAHSSQGSGYESEHTRPTPTLDGEAEQKQAHSRKRKAAPGIDDQDRKKRGKSDPNSVAVHRKERREARNSSHHEITHHRSESPPSRRHKRAQSVQSVDLSDKIKRKKAPPPPLVERRRKVSEDTHGDSDDSSSAHSHPHLQKIASVDHSVMSPAKLPYKKNRDRNGRTLLARACAIDITEARRLLKERPEDIDVPDNAGNTPLQIASLEGLANVVQLLLEAGCDTTCKNIDMETPLVDAVENGHLEVVQLLLNAGLDPRQSNAKGEEPLDLVNPDNDDYDEIRAALMAARESSAMRRPSGDHSVHDRDNDMSSIGASAASPTDGQTGRSPPPPGLGARRRTARSQPTPDSLLWASSTPAKMHDALRQAAGKGDMRSVTYLLEMRPEVETAAVIAAARGGHDEVLGMLLAMGQPEHDPDPVEAGDFKPGRNTPMLAAIGRGHITIIKLLLNQREFDPTRRLFRGLTYHELAKERQGSNWEEEYTILKEAYDDYKINGNRRSNQSSPRKVRTRRPEVGRSTSTSPPSMTGRQPSSSSIKTAPDPETKREHSHKAPPNKHLSIPEEIKDSAVVSDRDSESTGPPEPRPKAARSVSDASHVSTKHSDAAKPKRKLLCRNDFKSDQDARRRASLAHNTPSHEPPWRQPSDLGQEKQKRKMSESSISVPKVRQSSSKDLRSSKIEHGKKRPRLSTSPKLRGAHDEKSDEVLLNKKKRRVDSEGNAIVQDSQNGDAVIRTGPARVANMIASPEQLVSPSEPPNRAPVANMGVSSASPVTKSPTEVISHNDAHSPMSGIEHTIQGGARQQTPQGLGLTTALIPERHDEMIRKPVEVDGEASARRAAEREQAQIARDEEARLAQIAREEEQARLEQQRQAEEAERRARIEQEEEEARIVKKRREEELARRRAEQERLRREEQERRRAELEERERQRRIRQQEEEQQQRLDALPNALRRAAELSPEKVRQPQEVRKWLPLYTVTTREIDPGCDESMADERWIANVQAAPILAIRDLDLSQCRLSRLSFLPLTQPVLTVLADTAWTRLPLSPSQRQSLWRQVRNQMSQANINPLTFTWHDAHRLDTETYPKFRDLKSIFWIKLSEFLDIVPRHPHLAGLRLSTRAMVVHEDPWGGRKGGEENGLLDGAATNGNGVGAMVNGFR